MPKVSVIVPNYNHAPYLEQRIESILNQTYQDFELILLDDCSTDNSIEILKKYENHPKVTHFIINEQNSGSTFKQWDKGIRLAVGEWIWVAESDDWAEIEFLEVVMNKINQTKDKTSFYFTNSTIADTDGNKIEIYNNQFKFYQVDSQTSGIVLINKYLHTQNIFPNASAIVFNKELYKIVNHTELQKYKINGDWYLWINLLLKGDCVFVANALNNFRRHAGASSQLNVLNFKNIEEAMRINLFLKNLGYKYQDKYWLKFWLNQANYNWKEMLSNNFFAIFRIANLLYPFTSVYLIHKLIKIRMSQRNA